MYKCLIIDDEPLARTRLRKLLQKFEEQIQIIGEASDGEEGLNAIKDLEPDLVFLDIQMPVLNGFEMLQKISKQPKIIFITAFDQYAIKAFEENSIDYLLKPIEEKRLEKSIAKLLSLEMEPKENNIENLLRQLIEPTLETVSISLGDRLFLVPTKDIVFIKAEDKYLNLSDKVGKTHLLSGSLTDYEKKLGSDFIRIHRAVLINKKYIKEIRKGSKASLIFIMNDAFSSEFKASQSLTPQIRRQLSL
jgi:two-component system LytT family response regulator|tara:strand:- start:1932 stop:2675 length:744 start_codon:yes stop_codon:yes gene_type:complete